MHTKKHRLSSNNYIGEQFYFITIDLCSDYFKNKKLIQVVKDILDVTLKKYDIINLLTTFMYDHIHLILQGMNKDSNLKKCLKSFKSLVSINADIKSAITGKNVIADFNRRYAGFWHKDFYDHIIRDEKSLSKIIRYVLENPVRKGYVENYIEWEYSFSDKYNLKDFANIYYDSELDVSRL